MQLDGLHLTQHILDAGSCYSVIALPFNNNLVVQVCARLQQAAGNTHRHLSRTFHSLVEGAANMGHAVGRIHLGNRHIAYHYSVAIISYTHDCAVGVNLHTRQGHAFVLGVGDRTGVYELRVIGRTVWIQWLANTFRHCKGHFSVISRRVKAIIR